MEKLTSTHLPDGSVLTPDAERFLSEWFDERPYIVAHTSGSTGSPKEIRLLKNDMQASAQATIRFFGLTSASTLYLPLSPDYIAGKMQLVRALEAGCRIVVEQPSNSPKLTTATATDRDNGNSGREEISLLPVVPSQVDAVIESPRRRSIKAMIVGGAPLSVESERRILQAGIPTYATYGMTETCSHVALRKLGDDEFRALPGFTFTLDERGCLAIESSTLSFSKLITNDIVDLTSPSSFRWLGRHDNVINSGGIKIFPEEIERKIAPIIGETVRFYVSSRPSARWGEEAVIVTDTPNLPPDMLDTIKLKIGSRLTPKAVIFDPDIRLTASQKIIRRRFNS